MTQPAPLVSADGSLTAAWACFDDGRLQDAIQLAQQSLKLAPEGRPHALAALSWFLLSAGSVDEARTLLASSIGRYPDHAPLHWYLGLVHLDAKKLHEASQALLMAVTFDPQLDDAAVTLAWVLADLGRFEEATHYCRQALAVKRQTDRIAQLGWLLLSQKEWQAAAVQLTDAVSQQPENADVRSHLATALQHLHRHEEALKTLSDGLALSPTSIPLLQQHIRLLTELHRTGEAHQSLGHLLALAPEDAVSNILAAVVLEGIGDLQAASEHAERAVTRAQDAAEAWQALAQVRARLGRWDDARQAIQTALALEPHNPHTAYSQLGWICLAQRQYAQAIAAFTSAAESNANDGAAWYGLAEAYRAAGRYPDALHAVSRVLELRTEWVDALLLKSRILIAQGPSCWDEAVLQLNNALQLQPQNVEVRCQLSSALQRVGRDHDALTVVEAGLAQPPAGTQLFHARIQLLLKLQRTPEAHVACRQLLKAHPMDGMSWYLLSQVLAQRKRSGIALRALTRAQRLAPTLPEVWTQTGWLALESRDLRTAQAACERLLAIAPQDVTSHLLAALVFEQTGDFKSASEHAERAVALDGQSPDAWRALAQIRARQFRVGDATEALQTALSVDPIHTFATYRQLGWLSITDCRFDDAILAFRAATENNPDDAQSWYGLAEANRAAGKRMDALKAIKHTLRLREDWNDRSLRGQIIHEQVYDFMQRNWHNLDAPPQPSPMPFPNPETAPATYEYVLCSLSTKSHLHLMRALAASARKHFSGKIYLLVVDSDAADLVPEGTTRVHRDDVIEPSVWDEMLTRYNVLERCCALKAYLMRFLARTAHCPIVYLDADTYLMAPLHPVLPATADFSVALTPHLLTPLSGDRHADEIGMLSVGAYNGGMLVTGLHPDGIRFLDWWLDRVTQYAYDSREQGVFTDQKWLDLVPSFFRNVYVSRAMGLNVGHWRVCSQHDFTEGPTGTLKFCGEPVTLMHMSGFKPHHPNLLAQHILPPVSQTSALGRFLQRYAQELIGHQKLPPREHI